MKRGAPLFELLLAVLLARVLALVVRCESRFPSRRCPRVLLFLLPVHVAMVARMACSKPRRQHG